MSVYEMIRQSMKDTVPFAKHTGIELEHIEPMMARASLEQTSQTTNHMGSQHAGALFTLGETAAGGAVAASFAPFMLGMKAFPTDMGIRLEKLGKGRIVATAQIHGDLTELHATLKAKKRVEFESNVNLVEDSGNTIGSVNSSWVVKI